MNIRHLRHDEIDRDKWDNAISQAKNGLIYAYSWYLDGICEQWDALVTDDYEVVMPLPYRKKWGISYLYQPYFCASLGVFAKNSITEDLLNLFLASIPNKFKYWDICLNYGNTHELKDLKVIKRKNFILALNSPYEILYKQYRNNLKRNIERAKKNKLRYTNKIEASETIDLARSIMQQHASIEEKSWNALLKVVQEAKKRNCCKIVGVRLNESELLAAAIFFCSHHRWYYILAGNHPNGKTLGAMHFLLDQFIADHAASNCILDFEGSDAESLAFFYSGFGAKLETYPALRINKLPMLIRWLKPI